MSALKLHTLKQKLWAIVAASFIARVVMFFALPNTPSSLAPDEGTYAFLQSGFRNQNLQQIFQNFGEGLYLSGRSVIIPASTLINFGMNELDAVRLTSSVYGLLSLCAAVYLATRLLQPSNSGVTLNKKIERLVVTLFVIYAFLPSHFVWSNLGLRESPNEFWLIMTFIGVFLLYKEGQPKKPLLAVLVSISIICTFGSRPQVGWVLVVTLLIYSMFKLKNKLTYLLITSVLTGLFAGYLTTTSFAYVTSDLYVAKDSTPTPTKDSTPTPTKESTPTPTKESTPTPTKETPHQHQLKSPHQHQLKRLHTNTN
jgi:4-amino-4-deoxy-L-arabinose transferase-like glycosyltransferase